MVKISSLGRTVVLFGICFFLVGYVHSSFLMYLVSLFCLALICGSAFYAWWSLQQLDCTRSTTGSTVFSGDPLEGKVRVIERKPRWRQLVLFDQHVNRVNRQVTRRRMTLLTEGGRQLSAMVAGARQAATREKGGRVLEVQDVMRFARRGHYHLGPLIIQSHDPLGLCTLSRTFRRELDVIVYPRPLPLPSLVLGGMGGRQNTEVRPVGHAGETAEFHGIRPYVQGDDLRRVHWKATAHTNKLAIKEFEYRYSGAVQVILDLQHGVHYGEREFSTLEASITLTASILNYVLSTGNHAGLLATSGTLVSLPQESGQKHLHRALEALALARDDGKSPLAQVLVGGPAQLTRRCTAVVVTPSLNEQMIGPLLALRGRAAQVLLVLLDPHSFYAAEQEQKRPRNSLLALATTPIDLKGLAPARTAPKPEQHTRLLHAAAAAGIQVYPVGAGVPLHQALQAIRMHF